MGLDARRHADLALERPAIEAREHGHAQAQRARDREIAGRLRRRLGRGARHRQTAARMDVEHEHAVARRLADGRADGVRDVVELEIEEDAKAPLAGELDRGGTGGGEELRADLAAAQDAVQAAEQGVGLVQARDVERDEDSLGGARGGRHGTPAGSAPAARP